MTNCVVSMKRLAQLSKHAFSFPEKYVDGDETHLSQHSSVSLEMVC